MKKHLTFIVVALCMSSCAFWDSVSGTIHVPKYTVGTIVIPHYLSYGGGPHSVCEYAVDGVLYRTDGPYPSHYLVKGEKYRVEYDSLHPGFAEVIEEEPVFLPDEEVITCIGEIRSFSKVSCIFAYLMTDTETLAKQQSISKGALEKYPLLKVGAKFEVKFDPDNPQRAIIYLDKPYVDTTVQKQIIIDDRLEQH
jgi:hypothetical protein